MRRSFYFSAACGGALVVIGTSVHPRHYNTMNAMQGTILIAATAKAMLPFALSVRPARPGEQCKQLFQDWRKEVGMNVSEIFYADLRLGVPDHLTLTSLHPVFGEDEPEVLRQLSRRRHLDPSTAFGNVHDSAVQRARAATKFDQGLELHLFSN